jgi:serine/threonine protein phosphatase 1
LSGKAVRALEFISRQPSYEPGSDALHDDHAIYGVGDIHGMDRLLSRLLPAIEDDADAHGASATVVFLGDAVNRGPDTRQVLDRLIAGPTRAGDKWIVLRGNHEQIMLKALLKNDMAAFQRWLKIGGGKTISSYGGNGRHDTPEKVAELIDPAHLEFLAALPLFHVEDDLLFVHAGVDPGVPLKRQTPATLLNIRGRFLKKPHRLPFTVIHGHTPTSGKPMLGPGRVGIDTGAYVTGILTAIAIDGPAHGRSCRFLSVGDKVSQSHAYQFASEAR